MREIRIRSTGQVVSEIEFKALYPTTHFANNHFENALNALEADLVHPSEPPTVDKYQVSYRDGVKEIDGKWYVSYSVVNLDADGKKIVDADMATNVRAERNRRLVQSDWTQVEDVPVDKAAWAAYRAQLRNITSLPGFPWDFAWPVEPTNKGT